MLTSASGWFNGDFNYDGQIDGSDYTLMDNAFNAQGGQLPHRPSATASAVVAAAAPAAAVSAKVFQSQAAITLPPSLQTGVEQLLQKKDVVDALMMN